MLNLEVSSRMYPFWISVERSLMEEFTELLVEGFCRGFNSRFYNLTSKMSFPDPKSLSYPLKFADTIV